MTLVYVERFEAVSGVALTPDNWQRLAVTCMMLASKVWDDDSYENDEFAKACPLCAAAGRKPGQCKHGMCTHTHMYTHTRMCTHTRFRSVHIQRLTPNESRLGRDVDIHTQV